MAAAYTLRCFVPDSSAEDVFEYFVGLAHLLKAHPLIVDVKVVSERKDEQGRLHKQLAITDQLYFLGFIPYKLTYHADMEAYREGPGQFAAVFQVQSSMSVCLHHKYAFVQENAGVAVTDAVTVQAPWLLQGYVLRTARAAHEHSMALFPELFRDRASAPSIPHADTS